jgi:putative oxidoreductase
MNLLVRLYSLLVKVANSLQSPFLLVVRCYWGWQFAQSGWGHLTHMQKTVEFFSSLNIPLPAANAWFISLLEFAGGILLIIGLGSRLVALLLTGDMVVAYVTADRDALKTVFASDNTAFLNAAEFSLLAAALVILIFGPGKIALDHLLQRGFASKAGDSRAARAW